MQVHATTKRQLFTKSTEHGWDIVRTPSRSAKGKFYTIDVTHGRCSCPAWIFQKGGERLPCKHLKALGFTRVVQMDEIKDLPKITEAQKQNAMVVELNLNSDNACL